MVFKVGMKSTLVLGGEFAAAAGSVLMLSVSVSVPIPLRNR